MKAACNPLNDDSDTQYKLERKEGKDWNHAKNRQRGSNHVVSHNVNTNATHSDNAKGKLCIKCDKSNHYTSDCGFVSRMAEEDRQKFISNNRLCFYCLLPNHSYRECATKLTCKVTGCGDRHATVNHSKLTKIKESKPGGNNSNTQHSTIRAKASSHS